MIKGHCFTNLVNYDCSEVKVFARVPNIGEYVRCKYKGNTTYLKVKQIYHEVLGPRGEEQPYIKVELNI